MRLVSAPDIDVPALRPSSAGESRWKRAAQIDTIMRIEAQRTFHRELSPRPGTLPADVAANFPMLRLSGAGRPLRRSRRWTGGDEHLRVVTSCIRYRRIVMSPSATALVVPIALALALTSARRSPCSDEIASLETAIKTSESTPVLAPTAPQSVGAQLHHQPTPQSVQRAEAAPSPELNDIITRAKVLDAEGKTKECMELVAT